MGRQPPFEITAKMVNELAEIAELLGRIGAVHQLSGNPNLRRTNRIRTVYGSLAIEQNTLSLDQVTAVLNGKRVLAPPKDIAEVKNAYEIYGKMDSLNPYSVDDLLYAHSVMTRGLVEESGVFRSGNVGVVDSEGHVLHFGTLPDYVPDLVFELLEWARDSEIHMLIRSCVVHYELELIHPFADGNGRVGRLWHTLMLSKWNPIFAWLPVESIIHDRQQEYYDAINASNELAESTPFITFMLSAIRSAVMEVIEAGVDEPDKKQAKKASEDEKQAKKNKRSGRTLENMEKIRKYLRENGPASTAVLADLLGLSEARTRAILAEMEDVKPQGNTTNRKYCL